ncbi:MAG: hypothetical protein WB559_11965, partial [Candidatus Acidiferrales bacterium]
MDISSREPAGGICRPAVFAGSGYPGMGESRVGTVDGIGRLDGGYLRGWRIGEISELKDENQSISSLLNNLVFEAFSFSRVEFSLGYKGMVWVFLSTETAHPSHL